MSQKNVVRRTSTSNRRKNTDGGDRTDSGCFEDVDVLQMANRHCQPSGIPLTKNTATSDGEPDDKTREQDRPSTGAAEVPTETPSNSDECVDDTEFRAILERLAEVTKNPGDLYRLCFSSRLSFCGLPLGGTDEEGSLPRAGEIISQGDEPGGLNIGECGSGGTSIAGNSGTFVQEEDDGVLTRGTGDEKMEHKNCANRQQCVELLSLLSSFVGKAKENTAVFSQSGLGKALLTQLSSLLTTLEEAKENPNVSKHHSQAQYSDHSSLDSPQSPVSNGRPSSLTDPQPPAPTEGRNKSSVTGLWQSEPIGHQSSRSSLSNARPYTSRGKPEVKSERLLVDQVPCGESTKDRAVLGSSDPAEDHVDYPVSDGVVETMSLVSDNHVEAYPPMTSQDGDHVLGADVESQESDDVVSSGRRAVKPYSWDYGDIWEKELQRAQSSDSFQNGVPGDQLMPTFEEIRDELFHKAGFVLEGENRVDGPKRRSRSADARSSLDNDPLWDPRSFPNEQSDVNSPFVRTVYQHGSHPNSGLLRSRSSHLLGRNSITVNVNRAQGRQVRLFPENRGQVDDSWAQTVKDAVVGTSTFRGPKPWAMLKRRPSGLRRRSSSASRPDSFRSDDSRFPRMRLDSHGDSESSDSPNYVSATSSDCLTTDDSSSITSSHYLAASSVQSSPTVSNRNSACFSDAGSDMSDLRRIVFQDSSPESCPGEKYPGNWAAAVTDRFHGDRLSAPRMDKWDMTLSQRFGCMNRNSCAFSEPDQHRLKITANNLLRQSYQRPGNFRGSDPTTFRDLPSNFSRKWSGERERLTSPLIVRSDSDLNRLTKVHFVGDSYSRSRVSKNVRHARKASRSPSPAPRATHTRVVSCEIVQSDQDKRDVYTKVSLSRSANEDDATSDDYPNPWSGRTNTRRSWHGHSPPRGFSRSSQANANPPEGRRPNSERYPCSSGLVDRRRQVFRAQKSDQADKPLHATLVEVKNIQERAIRPHNSTGSLVHSDKSRHWSNFIAPALGRGYRGTRPGNLRQCQRNYISSRNNSFGRAQALFERQQNPGVGSRRLPPEQSPKRDKNVPPSYPGNATELIRPVGQTFPTKTIENKGTPATPHIVKETSFVGPATFTKYQSPTSPPLTRSRRSKSLNEKDNLSRRRLQESDVYKRRAMEIAKGDTNPSYNDTRTNDSDAVVVLRPERRRRYSEGARKVSRTDSVPSGYVVDESYCDPRRESIREGTYSIVSAESARNGARSGDDRPKTLPLYNGVINKIPEPMMINEAKNPGRPYLENERLNCDENEKQPEKRLSNNVIEFSRKSLDENENLKQIVIPSDKETQTSESSCLEADLNKSDEDATSLRSTNAAVSPVLRAKELTKSSSGVNVFIDYRNKRPVSVEYSAEEGLESRLEDSSRTSTQELLKKGVKRTKEVSESTNRTTDVSEDLPKLTSPVVEVQQYPREIIEEEFPRRRMSRRDRHEQEVLSNLGKGYGKVKEKETIPIEVLPQPPSPVPYRRDKTIVYVDARSSFDSDTDSISHDSTISSSGSEMTVITNDDRNISAGDLRQLAQSGSDIGIDIDPLDVDFSDDFPDSSDSTPEKTRPDPTDWSTTPDDPPTRQAKHSVNSDEVLKSRVATSFEEPGYNRSYSSKGTGNNQTLAHAFGEPGNERNRSEHFKRPNDSEELLTPPGQRSSGSSFSSITSSRESGKGIGTSSSESSKGKHSGKSGESGKGFMSRLKSIRNSFRGKKTDGKGSEKSGKSSRNAAKNAEKCEKAASADIRRVLGSRSLPIFDSNSNEMSERTKEIKKLIDKTTSSDDCSKVTNQESLSAKDGQSRRSYEALKQPSDNLRSVVGVKSVSSDHLYSYRANRPQFRKVSTKSLEVLVETCI